MTKLIKKQEFIKNGRWADGTKTGQNGTFVPFCPGRTGHSLKTYVPSVPAVPSLSQKNLCPAGCVFQYLLYFQSLSEEEKMKEIKELAKEEVRK